MNICGCILVILFLIPVTLARPISTRICDKGFIFDSDTGKCENCDKLCSNGEKQNDCKTVCSAKYLKTNKEGGPLGVSKSEIKCPDGYYLDPHIRLRGKCEPCSKLCYDHNERGTTKECKLKCKGFQEKNDVSKNENECAKGFYFDRHIGTKGKCQPCSVLCYEHNITGSTEECKTKCPDEYYSQNKTEKTVVLKNTSKDTEHSPSFLVWAGPSAFFLSFIVIILVITLLKWPNKIQHLRQRNETIILTENYYQNPEEENLQEVNRDENNSQNNNGEEAFCELNSDRMCSYCQLPQNG